MRVKSTSKVLNPIFFSVISFAISFLTKMQILFRNFWIIIVYWMRIPFYEKLERLIKALCHLIKSSKQTSKQVWCEMSATRFEMQHVSNMNLCQNRCSRFVCNMHQMHVALRFESHVSSIASTCLMHNCLLE